jgi:hypothetical protein
VILLIATGVLVAVLAAALALGLMQRNVQQWIVGHTRRACGLWLRGTRKAQGPVHVMFLFTDHYEPLAGGATDEVGRARVQRWLDDYPKLAGKFRDADGCPPKHTFFYPEEEYRPVLLDMLGRLCREGFGEVEVHLHHDHDTPQGLLEKIERFKNQLHGTHGMLAAAEGKPRFAFIHGNWALDNSRADGRWCGVNNEISLLAKAGCYADFTLPSAPNDTQTSTVNSIYYATGRAGQSKSHDRGVEATVGGSASGELMIFQGPLALNWRRRKLGIWPKIENADIEPHDVPIAERVALWVEQWVHVSGRPEWVFVKVHSHGATERNADWIFGGECERLFEHLHKHYNDGRRFALHYVTAREAYNIAKAAEAGKSGDPNQYRNHLLHAPAAA